MSEEEKGPLSEEEEVKKASPEKRKKDKKHSKKDKKHSKKGKKHSKKDKKREKKHSKKSSKPKDEEEEKKKAAPKRKKPENPTAKPKGNVKLKDPADALAEFPPTGLSATPDRQRRYVRKVLFESSVETALCTEEEYNRINRDKNGTPRPEQVCWISISVIEYDVNATALALRQVGKPGVYFPMNFNAEKRFVKSCYEVDYPKFKPRVRAYHNRLPYILGLDQHSPEFAGISFVSDRWYLKDEPEDHPSALHNSNKALFSEKKPYIPVGMRIKIGNMMDTMDVDDQVEQSYDNDGPAPSSSEEDKSIHSSEEEGPEEEEEDDAGDDESDDEDGYDDEERAERKEFRPEPIAKRPKAKGKQVDGDAKIQMNFEEGIYVSKPAVQAEAEKLAVLDKLIAPRAATDEVKAVIQQCNETYAVHLMQGESQYDLGVFSVSRVEKTAKFIEKTRPPETRNTVKLDTIEEPERAATPPPPPPAEPEPMPSEKKKNQDSKKRSPDEVKISEPVSKKNGTGSGALKPKYLNHTIATAIKNLVLKKPETRLRYDKQADYAELLRTEFSFAQLVGSAKELEAKWPLLYPLLQLWFEFYCQEHNLSVEGKSVNDVVRDWVKSMEAAKMFDMVIKADVQLVPEEEASKMCLYKLVEKAARGQLNMTERVRRLFNPRGKMFKLFPENDSMSEEEYRKTFRESPTGQATLFTALELYERASAAGTCIWAETLSRPPPPPEDDEPEF